MNLDEYEDDTIKGLIDETEEEKFHISKKPRGAVDYIIHLSENIDSNFEYVSLLNTLRQAAAADTVTLYLANYGGQCSTGFQLVNAIKDCKCGVDIILDAPSYSMGAIIALAGKSLVMNPGTFLMFHNYSSGSYGKGKEHADATMHYFNHFHRHLKTVVSPFLDNRELKLLREDHDVYISADDQSVDKRIKRHFRK